MGHLWVTVCVLSRPNHLEIKYNKPGDDSHSFTDAHPSERLFQQLARENLTSRAREKRDMPTNPHTAHHTLLDVGMVMYDEGLLPCSPLVNGCLAGRVARVQGVAVEIARHHHGLRRNPRQRLDVDELLLLQHALRTAMEEKKGQEEEENTARPGWGSKHLTWMNNKRARGHGP